MYVCICHGVTDRAIRRAAESGARTMADLTAMTGCGSGCGSCVEIASELLAEARALPLAVFNEMPVAA